MLENTILEDIENKINNAKYLIFDMDDTLVYTSYANFLSYQIAIYEVLGIKIKYNQKTRFTQNSIKELFPTLEASLFEQIVHIKNELFVKCVQNTQTNFHLIHLVKKYMHDKTIILATNSNRKRAIQVLKHHNLYSHFDALFYKESDATNKYRNVFNKLPINPQDVVIFENELSQIILAKEIGISQENIIKI